MLECSKDSSDVAIPKSVGVCRVPKLLQDVARDLGGATCRGRILLMLGIKKVGGKRTAAHYRQLHGACINGIYIYIYIQYAFNTHNRFKI